MKTGFCNYSKMFQLFYQPSPRKMFHKNYAFFSSSSINMKKHFYKFSDYIINSKFIKNKQKPLIIELGCNDGIFLKNLNNNKNIKHLGIEPSDNVAKIARKKGLNVISEFFDYKLAKKILKKYGKADVIVAANVMCHIPNILNIIKGLKLLLKKTGAIIFEDPYLGDVVKKKSYDQIYDEHVFLFSANSISFLFNKFNFEIIDAHPQNTHGGSMRYVIANENIYKKSKNIKFFFNQEKKLGLDNYNKMKNFDKNIKKSKRKLLNLLQNLKNKGKTIAAYAATSKSTTIFNYCKIGPNLIDYICDTTPNKIGKYSPGVHIPIKSHEFFLKHPPDYLFLLGWNHKDEIMRKEKNFIKKGGKWITHIPYVSIIK